MEKAKSKKGLIALLIVIAVIAVIAVSFIAFLMPLRLSMLIRTNDISHVRIVTLCPDFENGGFTDKSYEMDEASVQKLLSDLESNEFSPTLSTPWGIGGDTLCIEYNDGSTVYLGRYSYRKVNSSDKEMYRFNLDLMTLDLSEYIG